MFRSINLAIMLAVVASGAAAADPQTRDPAKVPRTRAWFLSPST